MLQVPSPGSRREQVAAERRRAAGTALPLGDRRHVDAQRRDAASGERCHQPTGPASEVDRRAGAAIEQPAVLSAGGAPPPPDRQVDLDRIVADEPGWGSGQSAIERQDGVDVAGQHGRTPTGIGGSGGQGRETGDGGCEPGPRGDAGHRCRVGGCVERP